MSRCQRAITSFAILSGRVDHGFAGAMHVLFPPRARQHDESCFRADMFEPAGYKSPAIPPVVTSAQSEAIDRWFGDDVEFTKLHCQSARTTILVGMQNPVFVRHTSWFCGPHSGLVEVADGGYAMFYRFPVRLGQEINAFLKG